MRRIPMEVASLSGRSPEHEGCNNCNGSGWKRSKSRYKNWVGGTLLIVCPGRRPPTIEERMTALEKRVELLEKEGGNENG